LPLLAFILRARRIGFSASARSNRSWVSGDPARRLAGMHELLRRKAADVERTLVGLDEVRKSLQRDRRRYVVTSRASNGSKSTREVRKEGNLAVLKAEWNVLVSLIRSGQLTTI